MKLGRISGGAGHRITGNRRQQGSSSHGARATGWEYVYVCVDDATRLAYVEVLADEKAATAVAFLRRAVAHFAADGVQPARVPQLDDAAAGRDDRDAAPADRLIVWLHRAHTARSRHCARNGACATEEWAEPNVAQTMSSSSPIP